MRKECYEGMKPTLHKYEKRSTSQDSVPVPVLWVEGLERLFKKLGY